MSTRINSLALTIKVPLSQQQTWDAIVNWEAQSNWMLQTKVSVGSEISEGVGTIIEAFTGPFYRIYPHFKWFGVIDLMRVTYWEPPTRCDVLHYGKVIKGTGSFIVEAIDQDHSYFHWSEDYPLKIDNSSESHALLLYF
jgi:hypothetical protein